MASKAGLRVALFAILACCTRANADPIANHAAPSLQPPPPPPPPAVSPGFGPVVVPPAILPQQPSPHPEYPGNREPAGRPPLIVAVGDSITVGAGDDRVPDCLTADRTRAGYGPRLALIEHVPVINEGVCGEDSLGGRRRIHFVLDRWRPDTVLILYSPNDSSHELPVVVENLRVLIEAAKQRAVRPVIGTLPPVAGPFRNREPFIVALNEQIRRLAERERIAVADHHLAFTTDRRFRQRPEGLLAPDGLHPNGRGYDLMALTWFGALHPAGDAAPPSR